MLLGGSLSPFRYMRALGLPRRGNETRTNLDGVQEEKKGGHRTPGLCESSQVEQQRPYVSLAHWADTV